MIAIALRHVLLGQLASTQEAMLDTKVITKPSMYNSLKVKAERLKNFTCEYGIWKIALPIIISTSTLLIALLYSCDIEDTYNGRINLYNRGHNGVYVIELLVSNGKKLSQTRLSKLEVTCLVIVIIFVYYMKTSRDNFYIKPQYAVLQIVTNSATVFKALSFFRPGDSARPVYILINRLCISIIILTFVAPLSLVYFRKTPFKLPRRTNTEARKWSIIKNRTALFERSTAGSIVTAGLNSTNVSTMTSLQGQSTVNDLGASYNMVVPDPRRGSLFVTAKRGTKLTIQMILDSEKLKMAFAAFLRRELAVESLLFIEAVKRYRDSFSQPKTMYEIIEHSTSIYDEFMSPKSPNEVNLPKSTVRKVAAKLRMMSEIEADEEAQYLFDEPANEISNMLAVNYIVKFANSVENDRSTEAPSN